jgi:hypothetical protein
MLKNKSDKKVLPFKQIFGKRMFLFPMEYATEVDPVTKNKGMIVSINATNTFIPCGEPVELSFHNWALLKNIGRVARIVNVSIDENDKKKV